MWHLSGAVCQFDRIFAVFDCIKGYGCTLRGVEGHILLQLLDSETGRMARLWLNRTVSWP
jgi:hypothetical protein